MIYSYVAYGYFELEILSIVRCVRWQSSIVTAYIFQAGPLNNKSTCQRVYVGWLMGRCCSFVHFVLQGVTKDAYKRKNPKVYLRPNYLIQINIL